jgi:hypothetical protein
MAVFQALVQSAPAWIPGEGFEASGNLLDRQGRPTIPQPSGPNDHYPDDWAGRIISIIGERDSFNAGDLLDSNRRVVSVTFTDSAEEEAARGHRLKMVGRSLAPVTFEDRYGASATDIITRYGSVEAAEEAEARIGEYHTNEDGKKRLDPAGLEFLDRARTARKVLKTILVHTGAGLYEVGPGKTYSTWNSAAGQLWTDQGSATFTSTQIVRGFADSYNEDVTFNASLNPDEKKGYQLVAEGDPNDSRSNIVVTSTSNYCFFTSCDSLTVRHLKCTPLAGDWAIYAATTYRCEVRDIIVSGSTQFNVYVLGGNYAMIEDSDLSGTSDGIFVNANVMAVIRNNTIKKSGAKAEQGINGSANLIIEGNTISGYLDGIYHQSQFANAYIRLAHNTIYNCTDAIDVQSCTQVELFNNAFDTISAYILRVTAFYDEGIEDCFMGRVILRDNIVKAGYTAFAYNGSTTKTYAEFAALDRVDADGDLIDTDPLLTDPANDDFSYQAGSPCIKSGHGSGVLYGINGVAFDANTPDRGAYSTGVAPPLVAPNPPSITATDQGNQSDVQVDIVADDPADVSTIYYQLRPTGTLQTWGTTVTGSGSKTLTGLSVAPWVIYAVAERGVCKSGPSNLEFIDVAAADQYLAMRNALYEWVKGVVGNPKVTWRETNAPQQVRPYVSLKLNPTVPVGRDYHTGADSSGIETVVGNREFVFGIQIHGKPSPEDKTASMSILERIRSSLEKRSIQATLTAAGLEFVTVEGFGDLAGIGGTEYQAMAFMDIRFRTEYQDTDDVGYVGTVETPVGTYDE